MEQLQRIGAALCALLALSGAHAAYAADCTVQYGYHTGSGFSRQDHTATVELNAGQRKEIKRNQMNFVRNQSNRGVKVTLHNKSFTLNANQVDPPAAFYLIATTLVSLECPTSTAAPTFGSPAQMAAGLKQAGNSAVFIAGQLRTAFNQNANQVATLLKGVGFSVNEIAQALQNAVGATRDQIAVALKAAGYTIGQVANALKSQSNATAMQVATALKAAGYTTAQAAAAVRGAFPGITRATLDAALRAAGFVTQEITAALNALYGAVEQALTPEYSFAYHGDASRGPAHCYYPSGATPFASVNSAPLPLPVGRSAGAYTVTFFGSRNMQSITGLANLPSGMRYSIRSKGNCHVEVRFEAGKSGAPAGTSGTGRLQYGQGKVVSFAWRTGPLPPGTNASVGRISVPGGGATASPGGGATARPDLVPTFIGTLFRHLNANRRVAENFCQNLPAAGSATQDAIGVVTAPNLSWGVINSANVATGAGFRIELRADGQVLRTEQVGALSGGGTSNYTYARPQSQTRVIRVRGFTAATTNQYGPPGCYQLVMAPNDPMNWQDRPFEVRVDTANAVDEGAGGETNNVSQY